MKRIAIALSVVFVSVMAVLLVAPSFIDWSNYRTTFEDRLAAATSRGVTIEGDVVLALLPRPAFQADAVRIANPEGAINADFVQAERVAVNLAFGPLLRGRLQFTSIDVVNPVINAEVLMDGTASWNFRSAPLDNVSPKPEAELDDAAFDFGVDSLSISNGALRYFDAMSGGTQSVEGVTLDLEAESVSGPFQISGEAFVLGLPWELGVSLGELRNDRPSVLSVSLSNSDTGLVTEFSGSFALAESGLQLRGNVSSASDDLSTALQGFGWVKADQPLPAALTVPFRAEASINANEFAIEAESLEISIGRLTSNGTGRYSWEDKGQFALSLSASRIDLEAWTLGQTQPQIRFAQDRGGFAGIRPAFAQSTPNFELPADLSGSIDLNVGLVSWRGQVMRNAHLSASLNDAEVTVTDAGLDLPGNSKLSVTGFVKADAGKPVIDMNGQASSQDLRSLLDWVGASPPPGLISPSRLNTLSLATHLEGSLDQLVFNDLEVELDATQLTGSAEVNLAPEIRTALNLNISRLDLDSYLPAIRNRIGFQTAVSPDVSEDPDTTVEHEAGEQTIPAINAVVNLKVDALTAGGNVFRGVVVAATADDGDLVIQNASIADFAGATLAVSGAMRDYGSSPRADALSVQVSTADLARLNRALDLEAPRLPILDGSVTADALVSGTLESFTVELGADLGALTFSAKGTVQNAIAEPDVNLDAELSHPEYIDLMRSVNFGIPRDAQQVGSVAGKATVSSRAGTVQIDDLMAEIGANTVGASLTYDTTNARPNLSGTVALTYVDFDLLFPADPAEQLARSSRGRSGQSAATMSERWTADPIDLSALSGVDGVLNVTAERLLARGLDVEQLTVQVSSSDGTINANGWQGLVYGGAATGDFSLTFSPSLVMETRLSIAEADMSRLGGTLSGSSEAPGKASGKVSLEGVFSAAGESQSDLVTSLSGQGRFVATGIDANSAGQGLAFTAVLAPVRALSQLGGVFSGGVTQGLATMGTEFSGQNGVFTLSNAALQSNVYSGTFAGTVDLPKWWIDVEGRVRLEVNVITQLLGNRLQMPSLIPLTIQGPLDLPNVKMDTSSGDATTQSPESTVPSQAAPAPSSQPNPADLFQGILNELTKPR